MREKIRDPLRICHALKAINKIELFMEGKGTEDLNEEGVLFYAIVKNLEIIGEAIYMLSPDFKHSHHTINWLDFEKLRHVLVHGYYTINPKIVYEIVKNDIPALKYKLLDLG